MTCSKCKQEKSIDQFNKDRYNKYRNGYSYYCKECHKEATEKYRSTHLEQTRKKGREYYHKNKTRSRELQLQRTYGLTLEEYNKIAEKQEYKCAICKQEAKGKRSLHVDHDHSCCSGKTSCGKCIRALICYQCNSILGYSYENIEILQTTIDYINSYKKTMSVGTF